MSEIDGLYDIRDYVPADKAFVKATFLRGLYYGDSWFSMIPKQVFMENYSRIADALIDNLRVTIKVACLKDEPSVILGYSMLSTDFSTAHWVHVKQKWRRQGIASSLLPARLAFVTHLSSLGKLLCFGGDEVAAKFPDAEFNPFRL